VTEFSTGIASGAVLAGIAAGPDGAVWFAESGTNRAGRILTSSPFTVSEFVVAPGSSPVSVASGPDGNAWLAQSGNSQIVRVTPGGVVTQFSAGITPASGPNAIAVGPDGNLWFSEATGNRIARFGSGVDVLVRAPAVYGAVRVGERALCDEGAWKASLDIGAFRVQWLLDGAEIAGATAAVYTPAPGDEGRQLSCRVAASSASVLAVYGAQSAAVAVAGAAVGPAGPAGPVGAGGSPGATGATGATGAAGAAGAAGANGAAGAAGMRGAEAKQSATATLLHARLATKAKRRFTVRYVASKGMRLLLVVRTRAGRRAVRLASLTVRKNGRGAVAVRHALAPGTYTLTLATVSASGARVVDAVPFVVRR
jgi:hypothetical protein